MKKYYSYLVVFSIFFVFVGLYGYIQRTNPTTTPTSITKTLVTENKTSHYTVNIEYPQISGIENSDQEKIINTAILKKMDSLIADFRKEVSGINTTYLPKEVLQSSLYVRSKVFLLTNKYVSIEFTISDMQAGAAHPTNYTETFNYDLQNTKELAISDLFRKDSQFIEKLSQISITSLIEQNQKAEFTQEYWIKQGASPKLANFEKFLLTNDSLIIIFDTYQVAPYASGVQQVSIPYKNIDNILQLRI